MALEVSFGCAIEERGGVALLRWAQWEREGVLHGISTRHGGVSRAPFASLNVGDHVGDVPGAVRANRMKVAAALGDMRRPIIFARQVHGAGVAVIEERLAAGTEPLEADALVTARTDVFLALCFADCVPLLFFDATQRVVAVAHAGWRGLEAGVIGATVQTMANRFGTEPGTLEAAVGPHIGVCCYGVGEDVATRFEGVPRAVRRDDDGKLFLNMQRIVRRQLDAAGLDPEHVNISAACTSCFVDQYFSHRAEGGKTGRFAAAIGLSDTEGGLG